LFDLESCFFAPKPVRAGTVKAEHGGTLVGGPQGVPRRRRVHFGPLPCDTLAWDPMPDDMR
jgi:hypothetical protein